MEKKPLIEIKNVTKNFHVKTQEIRVLRGISLNIYPGELIIILGPSGSGKSTLLNLILGLEPPSTGEVYFKGEPIHNQTQDYIAQLRKEYIGMVHQQANWIKALNVVENVAFPLSLKNLPKYQVLTRAKEKLEMFGMTGWSNFHPTELSSGQQQKIGLARALVTEPDIIVADEPTGNLDFKSGRKLVQLLSGLVKEGKTVVMVTHDLEYIEYADRIIRILDGKVFEEINNSKEKDSIEKLKKKIITQNIEAEKLYESEENSVPVVYEELSRKDRFKQKIRSMSFRNYIKKEVKSLRAFVDGFYIILILFFVILSLIYRVIYKILDFKLWPQFIHRFKYTISNIYYKFINLVFSRRGEGFNFADMVDLSVKNLLAKKTRTYVTIGGVALGVAFTVFLVSIGFGLERVVLKNFSKLDQLRSLDAYSSISQNVKINDKTVVDIANINGVEKVFPVIATAGKVNLQGSETDIVAYGIEKDYLNHSDLSLLKGEFFSNPDIAQIPAVKGESDIPVLENKGVKKVMIKQNNTQQAIVNTAFLDIFSLSVEDSLNKPFEVTLIATQEISDEGVDLESYPVTYVITGIVSNFDIPVIYIPIADVKELGVDSYTQARILTSSQDQVGEVRQKVDILGYRTESVLDTITQIENTFRNIRVVLTVVGLVALAVASFGMFNTLTVSLLERTREVGLLKVMGMKSMEVKELFLTESILLGLGGGLLGIFIGIAGGSFVSTIISSVAIARGYESIQIASIPILSILGILFVAITTGILTGLYPSRRATRISALDALRYE